MTTRAVRWLVLLVLITVLVVAYGMHRMPSLLDMLMESRGLALTVYSLFIAGPLWIAYGRLNTFDSSEGLRPAQAAKVNQFALHAKQFLLRYFSWSVVILIAAVVIFIADASLPVLRGWPSPIAVACALGFFVYSVVRIVDMLLQIEQTLSSVNGWKVQQKERSRQIAELRKARDERRLVPDEKLLRYRELAGEPPTSIAPSGASSGLPPPATGSSVAE